MKISDLLSVDNILLLDEATSKRQLLQNLTTRAANITNVDSRTVFDIVLERENLGSTNFSGGIGIPHGRIPMLNKVHGVFAKLNKPVNYNSVDDSHVDLVFLLVSPENSGADHLDALSEVAKTLKNEETCKKIRSASSINEIHNILTK